MAEEWKDIMGYEGLYQVSNKGNIKRLQTVHYNQFGSKIVFNEKLLNPCINGGYYGVSLYKDGKYKRMYVSRIVGLHFLPQPIDSKMVVAHIDPSHKEDNSVSNLTWNIINKCRAKKTQQAISIIKNNTPFDLLLEKTSGVYKITNIYNNKFYIGSAYNIVSRIGRHIKELRDNTHCNNKLQRSFNKYGEGYFKAEILETCNKDIVLCREQYHLDNLKPEFNIMSIAIGGSKSHKNKISWQ